MTPKKKIDLVITITGFILLLASSCKIENKSLIRLEVDNFENIEGEALQDKIRSIDLIFIPDSITKVSRVQKVSTSKRCNYILSGGLRSIVSIFSKDWAYLGRISQYGIDKGEFQEITDFCHTASGDTVFILDY